MVKKILLCISYLAVAFHLFLPQGVSAAILHGVLRDNFVYKESSDSIFGDWNDEVAIFTANSTLLESGTHTYAFKIPNNSGDWYLIALKDVGGLAQTHRSGNIYYYKGGQTPSWGPTPITATNYSSPTSSTSPSVPAPTPAAPTASNPTTGTQGTNGELTIGLNADIAPGIDQNKCPSGATTITRNGETFLAYPKGILKDVSCEGATKTLEDVLLIVKNIVTTILLPAVGILFIIMLLIGGIMYITSAGNPKQVERGKAILTAAIIGLLIVTLSYTIIAIFVNLLGGGIA